MEEQTNFRVSWVVPETALSTTISEIEQSGGTISGDAQPFVPPTDELEDYQDAQFDPLLVVASAVALGFLLQRISNIWLDHKRPGGLIVDARAEELVVRPSPLLSRGSLLVITEDGANLYAADQKDTALEVMGKIVSSG